MVVRYLMVFFCAFILSSKGWAADAIATNPNYDRIKETSDMIRDLEARLKANGEKIALLEKGTANSNSQIAPVPVVQTEEEKPIQPVKVMLPQEDITPVSSNDIYVEDSLAKKEHTFELGTEISHIEYKEPDVATEKGMFYGIYGQYEFRPQERNEITTFLDVFHADMHFNFGVVDYNGTGTIDNIDDYMVEPRLWVGKDIALGQTRLTPYFGFGYRWLYDSLGGNTSSVGALGYDRQSQYMYLPVGAQYEFSLIQGWHMALNAEYDIFLKGYQDSYLSDVSNAYPDIKNTQNKGYGIRGSIKITKTMERFNVVVEPYVRYWNIDDSNVATATGGLYTVSGLEPHNTSTEFGARLGVEF